mmetsp:Transcript_31933/g.67614  ORF Transcript_31933/g.67614 Transcript_31933/m.67614 type:complete len:443 (+) Transcript_31933:173-1501(+)
MEIGHVIVMKSNRHSEDLVGDDGGDGRVVVNPRAGAAAPPGSPSGAAVRNTDGDLTDATGNDRLHGSDEWGDGRVATPARPALRRKAKGPHPDAHTTETGDIESQQKDNNKTLSSSPPTSPSVSIHGRVACISIRELFKNALDTIFTSRTDEELETAESTIVFIELVKEAIVGIFMALFIVSFFLFVSYVFAFRLSSGKVFRNIAFLEFEESSGMQLLKVEEYEEQLHTIENSKEDIKVAKNLFELRSKDLERDKLDLKNATIEFRSLYFSTKMDQFCEECKWQGNVTCLERVELLYEKYGTTEFSGMAEAMKMDSCRKGPEQEEEERKRNEKADLLLADWDNHHWKFCPECAWNENIARVEGCEDHAHMLSELHQLPINTSRARLLLLPHGRCKRICFTCIWGNERTCYQRMVDLHDKYNTTRREARQSAMERPACWAEKL